MKKIILFTTAISLCALSTTANAQSSLLDGWSGEASANGSRTTGNTDTLDFGLGLKLQKEAGPWTHKFKGNADFGEVDGDTTRERYDFGYQIDRDINDRLYVFGNGDYFKDEFGAFQDGYFVGGGLGYKVFTPDPLGWALEAGAGFRSQQEQDTLAADLSTISGDTTNEIGIRGKSDFDYKLNENVSVYNDTEIIWSSSDTYIWNEVGLTAQLIGNLAARASYRVDYHSNPPTGAVGTDTISRIGVVYTLK
ncbi:MAG: DUF481 domain-containing protein [Litorimonas sp.]